MPTMDEDPERSDLLTSTDEVEDDESEPDELGAAETVPFKRETRAERAERRRVERARAQSAPAGAAPRSSASATTAASASEPIEGIALADEWDGEVHVFGAAVREIPPLRGYGRSLWSRREFLRELARAEVRRKHANTALGALWSLLDPLLQIAVYYMLFTIIRRGARPVDFLPMLIWGIFNFRFVTGAMGDGPNSISKGSSLMLNSSFPRALLPLSAVYKSVIEFAPTVLVVLFAHVVLGASVHAGLLLLVPLWFIQLVLSIGLSLFVSTLVVFFRDVQNVMKYVTRILFFTTPVLYPATLIPENLRAILQWQPLFALFESYQIIISGGIPSLGLMMEALAWAIVFFLVGAFVFLRHERDFARNL